jgi:hypothetical protein
MKTLRMLAAIALVASAARAEQEVSVVLQGGAARYNQSLSSTDTGAAYGARLGLIPTPFVGVELGYIGSMNDIDKTIGTTNFSSSLTTNEGYGDVRINVLPGPVMPYVFGGLGYVWVNGAGASGIPNSNTGALPFGGGLEANIINRTFKIGARYQYNYMFNRIYTGNNATVVAHQQGGNADFWTATVDLGASFK